MLKLFPPSNAEQVVLVLSSSSLHTSCIEELGEQELTSWNGNQPMAVSLPALMQER